MLGDNCNKDKLGHHMHKQGTSALLEITKIDP
jgi:hypothetical protein